MWTPAIKMKLNLGPLVFNAIRAIHATTPILILGGQYHSVQWYARNWGLCPGHTHIRDCSAYHSCNNVLIWSLDETCDQYNLTKGLCHWKAAVTWKQLVCPLKSDGDGFERFRRLAECVSYYRSHAPVWPLNQVPSWTKRVVKKLSNSAEDTLIPIASHMKYAPPT